MALYYRECSPSNCLANGLFLAASLSMKQSGQKSKLCVTLIACFITSSGKKFCIFSRPSTYILHVAITDVAISKVVLCSTSLDAWLHACLRLSSPNAENIFKMATAVELVKWLACLTSGQFGFDSRCGRRRRKFIFLLLSSASEGIVSRQASRPRASVARVSCN